MKWTEFLKSVVVGCVGLVISPVMATSVKQATGTIPIDIMCLFREGFKKYGIICNPKQKFPVKNGTHVCYPSVDSANVFDTMRRINDIGQKLKDINCKYVDVYVVDNPRNPEFANTISISLLWG